MTETLQSLERRIRSAEELHSVTRTMRGLAAVSLRHDELAAEAVNAYEAVVEDGLHIALRDGAIDELPIERPAPDAPTGVIVLGSNQGLCGPVNRKVAARARAEVERVTHLHELAAVGPRLATELEGVGLAPRLLGDLPATVEAVPDRAEWVLVEVERWRREGMARLLVVFPHFLGRNRGHEPVSLQLLPTDRDWLEWLAIRRWPSRVLPTLTMDRDQLVADLLRQALFVRLLRSFTETMASISASRLAAMDGAQRSIEQRLAELRTTHHRLRHSEITRELLDVIAGYETIEGAPGPQAGDHGGPLRPLRTAPGRPGP